MADNQEIPKQSIQHYAHLQILVFEYLQDI